MKYAARPRAADPRITPLWRRYAPAALVAALLVATALAFAYTEQLKLTPSPIIRTTVTKVFSPVCRCETGTASVAFSLRTADRVEIDIVRGAVGAIKSPPPISPDAIIMNGSYQFTKQ